MAKKNSEKGIKKKSKKIKICLKKHQNQQSVEVNRQWEEKSERCLRSSPRVCVGVRSESQGQRKKCQWGVDKGAPIGLVMASGKKVRWHQPELVTNA